MSFRPQPTREEMPHAWPIYTWSAHVLLKIPEGEEYARHWKYKKQDAPKGYGASTYAGERLMKRLNQKWITTWWAGMIDRNPGARLVNWSWTHAGYDTWASGWFEHWTYPAGRDDAAILDSFQLYVDRHERFNREWKHIPCEFGQRFESDPNCLMGAEDRWRWTATADGDIGGVFGGMFPEPITRDDPPCRCPGCESLGIVRVMH